MSIFHSSEAIAWLTIYNHPSCPPRAPTSSCCRRRDPRDQQRSSWSPDHWSHWSFWYPRTPSTTPSTLYLISPLDILYQTLIWALPIPHLNLIRNTNMSNPQTNIQTDDNWKKKCATYIIHRNTNCRKVKRENCVNLEMSKSGPCKILANSALWGLELRGGRRREGKRGERGNKPSSNSCHGHNAYHQQRLSIITISLCSVLSSATKLSKGKPCSASSLVLNCWH